MPTFQFFADAGLTVPLASLSAAVPTTGGSADRIVHFGSPDPSKSITRDGGGDLVIEVLDSDAGAGLPASAVKLALSSAGLGTATGGAALNIGASRAGGAVNALAVFVRVTVGAGSATTFADLALSVPDVLEV